MDPSSGRSRCPGTLIYGTQPTFDFEEEKQKNLKRHEGRVVGLQKGRQLLAGAGGGGGRSMTAAFGDINGDGAIDLLIGKQSAYNTLLIGDGTGRFSTSENAPTGSQATSTVAFGDVPPPRLEPRPFHQP